MIYLLALVTACLSGIFIAALLLKGRLNNLLTICIGSALGFGLAGQMIFYLQLLGGNFNHFLPPFLSIVLLGTLVFLLRKQKIHLKWDFKNWTLLLLPLLLIPLWLEANFFINGGWDAWSCWNLKAKFIYLGQEHWKDLFSPVLWRSNTGYPLLLPAINVWFWQWTGFSNTIPMLSAVVLTLLTAGTLLISLQTFHVARLPAALLTLSIFLLPLGNTLCISQYSDILFSLHLLCAFVCYFLYKNSTEHAYLLLSALFIGLMSFTKNEGLAAAGILTLLILLERPKKIWPFMIVIFISALPTVIFNLFMAPHSEAFVNGLFSTDKPATLERLGFILVYTLIELINLKWMGLWLIGICGIILGRKTAFNKPYLIVGLFLASYLCVTIAYYQVNTFFTDISWWMKFTLNRIIFVLLPVIYLWMGIAVFGKIKKDA